MNDKLKAELNKRIVTIFENIDAIVNQLINEDNIDAIQKWIDAQIDEPTSDDDEILAYAISSFGDNLIDYGKEFNGIIQ